MSKEERENLLKRIGETRKKALQSKESAFDFLVEIGMVTPKGNLRKPYR